MLLILELVCARDPELITYQLQAAALYSAAVGPEAAAAHAASRPARAACILVCDGPAAAAPPTAHFMCAARSKECSASYATTF